MKLADKVTPVMAALAAVSTLACCLPLPFAAAAVTGALATLVSAHQWWFIGASVVLLVLGFVQVRRAERTCRTRRTSSWIVYACCATVVVAVILFPQVLASILADWLP